jgi:predicted ATPase
VTELSSTESDAVVLASTAALLDFERSILLVDLPEISADERSIVAWAEAVRALASDVQILFATQSAALLGSVDPRAVVTLRGAPRGV